MINPVVKSASGWLGARPHAAERPLRQSEARALRATAWRAARRGQPGAWRRQRVPKEWRGKSTAWPGLVPGRRRTRGARPAPSRGTACPPSDRVGGVVVQALPPQRRGSGRRAGGARAAGGSEYDLPPGAIPVTLAARRGSLVPPPERAQGLPLLGDRSRRPGGGSVHLRPAECGCHASVLRARPRRERGDPGACPHGHGDMPLPSLACCAAGREASLLQGPG